MKRPSSKYFIALIIFIGTSAGLIAADIHPDTYSLGQREDGRIYAWVFFTPKRVALGKAPPGEEVSAKAQERRQRRGMLDQAQIFQLDQPIGEDFLQQIRETGSHIRQVSRWLNAVSVSATQEQLEAIVKLPCVSEIKPLLRMIYPLPPESKSLEKPTENLNNANGADLYGSSYQQIALMNIDKLHELGYSGRGVTVLVLDSGFYPYHESIDTVRILNEHDFLEGDTITYNETTAEYTIGQHNHGTYVYTALGGYAPGKLIGPAYRCSFLLAKTESVAFEDTVEEDYYVAGLEWGEAQGADILSSSLGYLDWYDYENDMDGQTAVTTIAVTWATRLGMLVVTAAGNERNNTDWGGYIIAPGDADSIITVGAVDKGGVLASFSSHGPTSDERIKPDVVGPGVSIYCASPVGPENYAYVNGTSMATPLVAGSAALLLEAKPNWKPADVIKAIKETASQANNPDNDYGWGIPDILAALNYGNNSSAVFTAVEIKGTYPNPLKFATNSEIAIKWIIEESSSMSLDVYNLLGEHIINLCRRETTVDGPYISYWRGIDYRGVEVPSGIYILRLTTDQDATSRSITLIR